MMTLLRTLPLLAVSAGALASETEADALLDDALDGIEADGESLDDEANRARARVRVKPGGKPAVQVQRVSPAHGVFVYGPAPRHHSHYHRGARVSVQTAHLPERQVDRDDSFSLGFRGGSYFSGYEGGTGYADAGIGLTARYRPTEFFALEGAVAYHNDTFGSESERSQWVTQGSAMVFAFPWARVSPYALGGVTWTQADFTDTILVDGEETLVDESGALIGPHIGAGVEIALGKRVALDLEARYAGFLNAYDSAALPGALQANAGLMFQF